MFKCLLFGKLCKQMPKLGLHWTAIVFLQNYFSGRKASSFEIVNDQKPVVEEPHKIDGIINYDRNKVWQTIYIYIYLH